MIKYSSKFSSYICYGLAHLVKITYGKPMSAGTGVAATRQRCAGVSTRQRCVEAVTSWGRVGFCLHARPESRNVRNDAGREQRTSTRRPPPRARHSTCARKAPPRLRPCACTFIYARTIRAQFPHQLALAALPHRRRRGAMPMPMLQCLRSERS